MRRQFRWAAGAAVFAAVTAVRADEPKPPGDPPAKATEPAKPAKTPAEQVTALKKEINDGQTEFMELYRKAKTDAERQKVIDAKYPAPQKFAARFLKLAEEHPNDPAAVDALVWVCGNLYGGPEHKKALDILLRDHVKSEKIAEVCMSLGNAPDGEKALRTILKENPHKGVQGVACYALGKALAGRANAGNAAANREAEQLFERAAKEYGDVKVYGRTRIGDLAEGELYEVRHLAVGMTAPEITAEDIDGTKFKLSDYRGKVVLLDFWGNW